MKFGFAVPAYGDAVDGGAIPDLVAAGEELGFDSIWWPDHIAVPDYAAAVNLSPPFLEPLAACAWGLGSTSRIRFGTDVLVAPYRHPLAVAAMTGTMGRLGGDRLVLGEGFSVVTPPTPVPVWVGGNNPRAHRRAALLGDGWHPLWLAPDDYADARAEILRIRREAAIDTPFTFSFSAGFTRFADVPTSGWPAPPPRAPKGSEFRYAPEPWVAPDGRPRLMGSPDELVGDLRLLADAGVDHVTLRFGTTDPAPLARFAHEVMPAFAPETDG
jgi:alkanesulfonate monooxygenase SsuD/methylene tetrahydromethanopterin reductase-like flavin-dependent oxidoreductase (luciferase family)